MSAWSGGTRGNGGLRHDDDTSSVFSDMFIIEGKPCLLAGACDRWTEGDKFMAERAECTCIG